MAKGCQCEYLRFTDFDNIKTVENKFKRADIIFLPGGNTLEYMKQIRKFNLGEYIKEQIPEKNVMLNDGYCLIHAAMTVEQVKKAKETYPNAEFLVHPECKKEILAMADYIGSTSGIINYATNSEKDEFIIGTENGVFYELEKKY